MSKPVKRQADVTIGSRKTGTMIAVVLGAALLVTDTVHWHVLHHLLGAASSLVILILVTAGVVWAWRRSRRRR